MAIGIPEPRQFVGQALGVAGRHVGVLAMALRRGRRCARMRRSCVIAAGLAGRRLALIVDRGHQGVEIEVLPVRGLGVGRRGRLDRRRLFVGRDLGLQRRLGRGGAGRRHGRRGLDRRRFRRRRGFGLRRRGRRRLGRLDGGRLFSRRPVHYGDRHDLADGQGLGDHRPDDQGEGNDPGVDQRRGDQGRSSLGPRAAHGPRASPPRSLDRRWAAA